MEMAISVVPHQPTTATHHLQEMMRRHPLFFFFFMAYAFSWILTIPAILSEWGALPNSMLVIFFTIKSFGPAVAAYTMIRVTGGKTGVADFKRRIFQWRVRWTWYVFILLGIPAVMAVGACVLPGMWASFQGIKPAYFVVNYLITFVLIFFGGGPLGEEPGWRGFALPRMQNRFGALRANLLLGVMWTFWHLPDFLTSAQGGGPGAGLSPFYTRLPIFFLMVMALTFIFSWVFNHTGGSVFIALLLHASFNTFGGALQPLFSASIMTSSDLPFLIGVVVLAVLIVILTRGRLGCQPGQEQFLSPAEIEAQSEC
jgi:membrane protease YdiL (CAAX protease family)